MQAVAVSRTCKKDQEHITYHIKELPRSYKGFGRPQVLLGSSLFIYINMPKKEVQTDLWVYDLLQEAKIHLTPQGCEIDELNQALKTASKSQTGKVGFPEYCGAVKDFAIVIEDKASIDKHIFEDANGLISQEVKPVKEYAVKALIFR